MSSHLIQLGDMTPEPHEDCFPGSILLRRQDVSPQMMALHTAPPATPCLSCLICVILSLPDFLLAGGDLEVLPVDYAILAQTWMPAPAPTSLYNPPTTNIKNDSKQKGFFWGSGHGLLACYQDRWGRDFHISGRGDHS